jgi:hypothetical protein
VDLSDIIGIAFTAKGKGTIRFSADMTAQGNYDAHGISISLTREWRRYTVRFDDPNFAQTGSGDSAVFNPAEVESLVFLPWSGAGPFDFSIDDLVLLTAGNDSNYRLRLTAS